MRGDEKNWKLICDGDFKAPSGAAGIEYAKSRGLEVGDILVQPGHTFMYVGTDAVEHGYDAAIKGTDGDLGEPVGAAAWVSGSLSDRAACIDDYGDARSYSVFRYVGDYPDKDKFADAGNIDSLQTASYEGTPCDCEREEETDCGEELAIFALEHIATTGVGMDEFTPEEAAALGMSISGDKRLTAPANPANLHSVNPSYDPRTRGAAAQAVIDRHPGLKAALESLDDARKRQSEPGSAGCSLSYGLASCSPWIGYVCQATELEIDIGTSRAIPYMRGETNYSAAGCMNHYMLERTDKWEVVTTADKPISTDDLLPGDILSRYGGHILMYVGNDLAQKYFPGTTGNCVESSENGRYYPGVTYCATTATYDVTRLRCSRGAKKSETRQSNLATGDAAAVIGVAQDFADRSVPYGYGHSSADSTDCSGLTMQAYAKIGVALPHDSRLQADMVRKANGGQLITDPSKLKAGDLLFYENYPGHIYHVALYLGNGERIHATQPTVRRDSNPFGPQFVGGGSPV